MCGIGVAGYWPGRREHQPLPPLRRKWVSSPGYAARAGTPGRAGFTLFLPARPGPTKDEARPGWLIYDRHLVDQVKPTCRTKCPSLTLNSPPPAKCTIHASKMMARIATTTQKKNTTMPGMAYPATVLATANSLPSRIAVRVSAPILLCAMMCRA